MKIKIESTKAIMQEEYKNYTSGKPVRDPQIPICFLIPRHTIKDLKENKPKVKVEHCPSDIFY